MDISQEVIEAANEIKETVGGYKKTMTEFEARLHHIEQRGENHHPVRSASNGSIGKKFIEGIDSNSAFSHIKEGNAGTCRLVSDFSVKSLVNEGMAGSSSDFTMPSDPDRRGIVIEVRRPLRLLDVLPTRRTDHDSVLFVQFVSDGEASEQEYEGDEKAEIDVEGIAQTANIVTIAGHTTVSRQALGDHDQLTQAIDVVMRHKVRSRLEHRLINGPGGQGQIRGLLDQGVPLIPTIGTTPADIVGEALVRQADAGYTPNLVLMNPLDWFRITLTKRADDDEGYVFGSPTMPVPPALWNTAIVRTPSIPEGSAMTVDTTFTTILDRHQPVVLVSTSHKDYFTRNLALILCEMRAGLEITDTAAVRVVDLVSSGS